jgi:hypothetical protein
LEVKAGHGVIVGLSIQPPVAIFGKIQFSFNAEFMTTLIVVGHPLMATTPLATLNEEVFVTILRLPIWPDSDTTEDINWFCIQQETTCHM